MLEEQYKSRVIFCFKSKHIADRASGLRVAFVQQLTEKNSKGIRNGYRAKSRRCRSKTDRKLCSKNSEVFYQQAHYSFIETRLILFEKKKRRRQWFEKDTTLALSLFNASRKTYRLLSKIFSLPSLSCLRGSMSNII